MKKLIKDTTLVIAMAAATFAGTYSIASHADGGEFAGNPIVAAQIASDRALEVASQKEVAVRYADAMEDEAQLAANPVFWAQIAE